MRRIFYLVAASLSLLPAASAAQDSPSQITQQVGIVQNLGAQLPLDVPLKNEAGQSVRVGDYLGTRPAVLTFVYYRCPMLCSKELDSLTRSLRVMSLQIGSDFDVITVSISPEENPGLASAKKRTYMKALDRSGGESGWHFLTGDAKAIAQLTETAGFRYKFNPKTGLYAHDAGLIVLTPEGRIAKYLPGLDYPAKALQEVLKNSSRGVIGKATVWVKLLCYDYDPATGKYSLAKSLITVLVLAASVLGMNRWVKARHRPSAPAVIA
jgi:protein SCO1/2